MMDTLTIRVPLGPGAREVTFPVSTGRGRAQSAHKTSLLLVAYGNSRKLTKFAGTETGLDGSSSFTGFGTQRILSD